MYSCPICKAEAKEKFKLTYNVYECSKCHFQFAPEATFDTTLLAKVDESMRIKALKNLRVSNFNTIVKALKKHVSSSDSGVEIGSGYGWFLQVCKDNGIKCLGIEPETEFNEHHAAIGVEVLNGFFPQILGP